MEASEFIRVFGLDISRMAVTECPPECDLDTVELKRLVESHELVEKVGGLSIAKDFCRDFECIHIGLDLIECRRLIKAIADVESCNENPN